MKQPAELRFLYGAWGWEFHLEGFFYRADVFWDLQEEMFYQPWSGPELARRLFQ